MPNSPPSPSLKIQSALNNSLVLQLVWDGEEEGKCMLENNFPRAQHRAG